MVDGGTGVAGNPVYQACVEGFLYTRGYEPKDTVIVSLGTGRFFDRPRPTWLYTWLTWILAELLRSNHSITLNLEELKGLARAAQGKGSNG